MKTLEDFKNEYALHLADVFQRSFNSWEEMEQTDFNFGTGISKTYSLVGLMEEVAKQFAIEVAKEALKLASENAYILTTRGAGYSYNEVSKKSILDENNIPKI